ncbi:MAG TPA: efflux RND transporter permease subunit, partial [Bacteroidales bacterium]|nr:efflux RND transporter permease subunit [Bacteroidales bacterium]
MMEDKTTGQGQVTRDFFLTRIALKNKTTVFLLTGVLLVFGLYSYRNLPKELFPEAVFPYIMVTTVYPGNSPLDIENLITRPIEKEIEGIRGVKKVTSNSAQDASLVFVEFNFGIDVDAAMQDVKDAVDRAKGELPNDLMDDPVVADIDFSEFPVITVNLSGDYSLNELDNFAEYLEDEIEGIDEVSKVDIVGMMDREIQINADPVKMQMMEVSMDDIENAVKAENLNISGGELLMEDVRMSLRTVGEFLTVKQIGDIVVKNESQRIVYLRDVASVADGFAEPGSFARLNGQPVVSLQVVKKSGANLLSAIDQVYDVLDEGREKGLLPEKLEVSTTNDQSEMIRLQLSNLENNMLMGMILVILVLFYFLGTRNALFVGLAIPTSMLLSFVVISLMGMTVNMMVLFSLILALGMLVDNAIVAVENIHRFISEGKSPTEASRRAVSEIAMPIISSTATTLAAFFPLAFWKSIVGEFMKDLPVTLIIVLTSSLFVALVIVPVFTATFIRPKDLERKPNRRRILRIQAVLAVLAAMFYLLGWNTMANLLVFTMVITLLNIFFFGPMGSWFQAKGLPWLDEIYANTLRFALRGKRPFLFILGSFLLLLFTLVLFALRQPKVLFFPDNEPQYLNILTTFPIGTDIERTNALTLEMEQVVDSVLVPYQGILKSKLTTVGEGAFGENEMGVVGAIPHRNRITVNFIDFEDRGGVSTSEVHEKVSEALIGRYPGVQVAVEKNSMGPPAGKPVNIELS